jgi:hypothetical protein
MELIRAVALAAICFIVFSPSMAFAWYWPILGEASPCSGLVGGPSPIVPGTAEWALQPPCGAQILPFGYPYGAIRGSLSFGITPPFSFSCSGFSGTTGFIGK